MTPPDDRRLMTDDYLAAIYQTRVPGVILRGAEEALDDE